ncbi:MarR family transcriptional regulator [Roseovarius faecimaris]|uniref:MarR family transcriptional regulator n=1 Tax=Roseovarius faecimaris TaxID=2494550 RepID=A0A6I6IUX3_9RHOB|nr:MarR family winged helix-turn-helix transcriptional regulator [Roseovarius faecimaris]QGX99693.1 MarR family transcriptional regulator [Roseovarius faecimaris]
MTDDPSAAADEAYELDNQIGYILRVASQRHAAIFQSQAPGGLTPTQFSALVRVAEKGACSQNLLGRLTSMDVATIKGVVDRLKRKGLVVLEPDPTDKRRTIIRPTAAALEMIGALHDAGRRISEATLEPLTPTERSMLIRLLRKIT